MVIFFFDSGFLYNFSNLRNKTFFLYFYFRDMFIDPEMRPKARIISESNLDYIFNFDENLQVILWILISVRLYSTDELLAY